MKNIEHGFSIPQALSLAFMVVDNSSYWHFNSLLRSLVKNINGKILVLGAGGGCRTCSRKGLKCTVFESKSCRNFGKIFPSPESWGIFVYKTLKRLKIPFQNPPRTYITRVGVICTKQTLDICSKSHVELPNNEKLINIIEKHAREKYGSYTEGTFTIINK